MTRRARRRHSDSSPWLCVRESLPDGINIHFGVCAVSEDRSSGQMSYGRMQGSSCSKSQHRDVESGQFATCGLCLRDRAVEPLDQQFHGVRMAQAQRLGPSLRRFFRVGAFERRRPARSSSSSFRTPVAASCRGLPSRTIHSRTDNFCGCGPSPSEGDQVAIRARAPGQVILTRLSQATVPLFEFFVETRSIYRASFATDDDELRDRFVVQMQKRRRQ